MRHSSLIKYHERKKMNAYIPLRCFTPAMMSSVYLLDIRYSAVELCALCI